MKRVAETDTDEMDQGRIKKVKKRREEAAAYSRGQNPLQARQNWQNRNKDFRRWDGRILNIYKGDILTNRFSTIFL